MNLRETLRVLLIEDNPADALLIEEMLAEAGGEGYEFAHVVRLDEALARVAAERPDVVLLDLSLPDAQGLVGVARFVAGAESVPVVVLTGQDNELLALKALQAGAQDYLIKGQVYPMLLSRSIRYALERVRAAKELRASQRSFETLLSNLPGAVYRRRNDERWVMEFVSEGWTELTGYPAAPFVDGHRSYADLIHADDRASVRDAVRSALAARRAFVLTYRIRTAAGEVRWVWEQGRGIVSDAGALEAVEGYLADVTERKRLEEQLEQASKMEAVGRLAGGIAHDFNNLLTAIHGYAQFLLTDLPEGTAAREDVEEIKRAAGRASDLTRQLLAFSRKQILQPRRMSLDDVVFGMEGMLRRLLGEDVTLRVACGSARAPIYADPTQIEQVILNLAVNARDAMPRGGTLAIETSASDAGPGHAAGAPRRFAVLAVADTGCGMSDEQKLRLFEPFYTTKERGTGLGLATVFGIVQQSGGDIQVESALDEGTTITVRFPVSEAEERPDAAAAPPTAVSRAGGESILLVEDDPSVRTLVRRTLERTGYRVLVAANPRQALMTAATEESPIHLLLTDVVMPDMNGRQLAERLAATIPGLGVLYMSGYTEDEVVRRGAVLGEGNVLQKPFEPEALVAKVREVLDAAAVRAGRG